MIQDAVVHKHWVQIGYDAVKKAKKLALGVGLQSQASRFAKLPNCADAIRTADPEAIAILVMEATMVYDGFIASLFVPE